LEVLGRAFSKRWKFCLAALFALPVLGEGVDFSVVERESLDRALGAMNAGVLDLGFKKDVGEPRSALNWVRGALERPLELNRAGQELWDCAVAGEAEGWWRVAAKQLEVGPLAGPAVGGDVAAPEWRGASAELGAALSAFFVAAVQAEQALDRAFAGLSEFELQYLAASTLAGGFNLEDEEATRAAFGGAGISALALEDVLAEGKALDATPGATRYLDAALKVDRGAVLSAGLIFQRAVFAFGEAAERVREWPGSDLEWDTPLGRIAVVVSEGAVVTNAALLVVNPRGDTVYRGGVGSANGLVGNRLAAIVDLGGDDVYQGDGLFAAGAALFGVAVALDGAGSDVWRAAYVGQGAGFFGVGWVEDRAGDDGYWARSFGQGAAVAGVGVLADGAGGDSYSVGWQGQGFAGWMGFGLLVDRAGADRYFAGGREWDYERNPDRYLSLSQGFSIGARPFAGGGVGALIDLSGNDVYDADVFGQGASYYYSAGFLLDGDGHDRYAVHHYGQGCGIHLSLGLLADFGGDDFYKGGTLAQGAAHDFGVGGLLDRAGNDTYVANRDAQGHGMNNALGWLVDGAGDDVYSGRDVDSTQGIGNSGGTRESGSVGLLLDLGGKDRYSSAGGDDRALLRPLYGVIYDVNSAPSEGGAP